ncbi:hypothetical protein KIN20_017125 [Parelaphostrongylus tenuis]|uniref:Uncharacterized protein n=1 Tax=Parelaphostrongylus tenuis TaxID=148309 RepID=A0AAD5QTL0_PARTN|nr:hypothetical protein KIN20_017125 [Parelaphostrongylus tenuis]
MAYDICIHSDYAFHGNPNTSGIWSCDVSDSNILAIRSSSFVRKFAKTFVGFKAVKSPVGNMVACICGLSTRRPAIVANMSGHVDCIERLDSFLM